MVLTNSTHWFGDFDVVSGNVELHNVFLLYRGQTNCLRWLDGGMDKDSRYLATVRRATMIP
ncbi:Uncharacterised protein [Serratia fonticola]|uniref:Uncharacterized protein n=1 Tax=Serratia fonticola TaxID=47917 RepID=A0A4U9W949_SERFO|nr:Uncharacterised protein [Serratia fonticola]